MQGEVGGSVISAGSEVVISAGRVQGDVWLAGEQITVSEGTQVAGNVSMAGEQAKLAGSVGKDLHASAERLEIYQRVGGDLVSKSGETALFEQAVIVGDAKIYNEDPDDFIRAPGAIVQGQVEYLDTPEEFQDRPRYLDPGFYLWELAGLVSAVLVGLVLLWLFPSLRNVSLAGGADGAKTAGLGFVALLGVPLIAVILAITLIGIPLALVLVALWVAALYLAKVIVGIFVGGIMLSSSAQVENKLMLLLVGVATLVVAVNLPFIGGFIGFLITIIGVGMLLQHAYGHLSARA